MSEPAELHAQLVALNEALILGSVRQHELTEQAEQLNAQLRVEMDERSLLEQRTREQSEALADLARRKDEFLAMLSHELRSPLAPIAHAVQVLRLHESERELQQKALGIIERQMGHLTRLVDDLLEVTRLATGKVQLRRERVAWSDIVDRAVETARPLLEEHGHELTLSVPPEPIWLLGDAARLEQVVVNLLTNAAKYSDDDRDIWLSVEPEGDWSVLRVRDCGVGIAPELLPHIFDLFTQGERSLDRSQGGLGVGLSLVQRLVELHGGTVVATSVLGESSEFVVRLPIEPASNMPAPALAAKAAHASGKVYRVLVVDDDEDTAEGMAMLLRASGHHVQMAHDGPAALATALDYRPDVVLMDIGLPMLNGFEVAERMRRHDALRDAVLVAITGYGQDKDRQRTREAGFDFHLVKPAEFGEVQQILATLAQRSSR